MEDSRNIRTGQDWTALQPADRLAPTGVVRLARSVVVSWCHGEKEESQAIASSVWPGDWVMLGAECQDLNRVQAAAKPLDLVTFAVIISLGAIACRYL